MNIYDHINVHTSLSAPLVCTPYGFTGTVRTSNGFAEIYDGNNWVQIQPDSQLFISQEFIDATNWAIQESKKYKDIDTLVEDYPALKAAYDNFTDAKQVLDVVLALVQSHQQNEQNG
jgi:hypothetical protein